MFSANSSQVSEDRLFVEDVFSTYLYTGVNGGNQTITNGIDLAGKGGLVWAKSRGVAQNHWLTDTASGVALNSNTISAGSSYSGYFTPLSNGYTSGYGTTTGYTYASWTFREAPKFFDVVTYTGNGTNGRQIAHSLGTTPGCVIIKCTSSAYPDGGTAANWMVWHKDLGSSGGGYAYNLILNETGAKVALDTIKSAASTTFTVSDAVETNYSGATYVAYLFAHDTTSDGIIQCGSFTTDGTGAATVNLGWEPQWLLCKTSSNPGSWFIQDNMRGFGVSGGPQLNPNTTSAENPLSLITANATGFSSNGWGASYTFVYIAIRRGPMRTPTSGTSVFSPQTSSASAGTYITTGFPVDFQWMANRDLTENKFEVDRLRGFNSPGAGTAVWLSTNLTNAEASNSNFSNAWDNTGFKVPSFGGGINSVYLSFRRAPSFFDEVCYTGTGATTTQNHNLGVVPELVITKSRSAGSNWQVNYSFGATTCGEAYLNNTNAGGIYAYSLGTAVAGNPTASQVQFYAFPSGQTMVSYLFASCPGVSKVGSYTGNGSSQTINCGFAAGARFVMIKRTDSTGDWYVWDSARGIVSGNDPHLSLNSTAAEVTTDDSVDTDSSGFVVNQLSATNINVSSATYIYLAVA